MRIIELFLVLIPMFRTSWVTAYLVEETPNLHVVEMCDVYDPDLDCGEYEPDYLVRVKALHFLGFGFFAKPISAPIPFADYVKYHTGAMQ